MRKQILTIAALLTLTACSPNHGSDENTTIKCAVGNETISHDVTWYRMSDRGTMLKDKADSQIYRYSIAVKCWRVR